MREFRVRNACVDCEMLTRRYCTDAFATFANHREMIYQPLQRRGVRVDTFLHSFSVYDCVDDATSAARLVAMLQPKAYEFETIGTLRHVDRSFTYMRALRLVLRTWEAEAKEAGAGDFILLCFLSVPVMMSMWLRLGVKSTKLSYS